MQAGPFEKTESYEVRTRFAMLIRWLGNIDLAAAATHAAFAAALQQWLKREPEQHFFHPKLARFSME